MEQDSMQTFIIDGNPLAKTRHRHGNRHGKIITWDPQDKQKKSVSWQFQMQAKEKNFCLIETEPIKIEMLFYLLPSKSWTQKKKKLASWGLLQNTNKPDLDNLQKFYLDCANKILFNDDKQITTIYAHKCYSQKPKTVIKIMKQQQINENKNEINTLTIFGPEKVDQLLKDVWPLFELWDDLDIDVSLEQKAIKTANILQNIAKNHANELSKIKKKIYS